MNLKDLEPGQRALLIHHIKPDQLPETPTPEQIENNRERIAILLVEKPRYHVEIAEETTIVNTLERVCYPPHPDDRPYGFMKNAQYSDNEVSSETDAKVHMLPIGDSNEVMLPNPFGEELVIHLQQDPAYYCPRYPHGKRIADTDKITRRVPEALIS